MTGAATLRKVPLAEFHRRRKEGSRERLLAAATEAFCAQGYFSVSVEDIASAAGVSRMTFYRHFSGKAAIAGEIFHQNAEDAMPRYLAIGQRDYLDHAVVADWIRSLFEADAASRQLLRVFIQAYAESSDFSESARTIFGDLIAELGRFIPAFALDPDNPQQRRRWLEAWLLFYEMLYQSNAAARGSGVSTDPLIIEILAGRFLTFVKAV